MRIIIAEMKAAPGKRAQLIDLLNGMLEPSRMEPGCISYRYFFSSEDPDLVHFYEQWQNQAAIDEHFASDHFRDLGVRIPDLIISGPDIRIYDAAPVEPAIS
ncbi:MAG: antibiotic biosynthesis monooxygenase [Planctomycetota bacterium]|nr:MAG: antibiotic biosynthesis monooxygenase [Planctomycetota bacterium]